MSKEPLNLDEPASLAADQNLTPLGQRLLDSLGEVLSSQLTGSNPPRLAYARRLNWGEFLLYRRRPTCLVPIRANEIPAPMALDLSLELSFSVIEQRLGGRLQGSVPSRPLTDIEQQLLQPFLADCLTAVVTQLPRAHGLRFAPMAIQAELPADQSLKSKQPVAVFQLEFSRSPAAATMSICLPWDLVDVEQFSDGQGSQETTVAEVNSRGTASVMVSLTEIELPSEDLASLQVGDIIETDLQVDGPLTVSVDGQPRFQATPGVQDGHKAVRIQANSRSKPE